MALIRVSQGVLDMVSDNGQSIISLLRTRFSEIGSISSPIGREDVLNILVGGDTEGRYSLLDYKYIKLVLTRDLDNKIVIDSILDINE